MVSCVARSSFTSLKNGVPTTNSVLLTRYDSARMQTVRVVDTGITYDLVEREDDVAIMIEGLHGKYDFQGWVDLWAGMSAAILLRRWSCRRCQKKLQMSTNQVPEFVSPAEWSEDGNPDEFSRCFTGNRPEETFTDGRGHSSMTTPHLSPAPTPSNGCDHIWNSHEGTAVATTLASMISSCEGGDWGALLGYLEAGQRRDHTRKRTLKGRSDVSLAGQAEGRRPWTYVSALLLPFIALVLLPSKFALAFDFSRLPKTAPIRELGVAVLASVLGGFGAVALYCTVREYEHSH
ncbi:hypothetical protein EDC04DRAFT_3087609 [Pisolithus marmoratus]|nr:hypothetical protein EDC04DRAFT_3087609 [Pisolithus marmoratus]